MKILFLCAALVLTAAGCGRSRGKLIIQERKSNPSENSAQKDQKGIGGPGDASSGSGSQSPSIGSGTPSPNSAVATSQSGTPPPADQIAEWDGLSDLVPHDVTYEAAAHSVH